MASRDDRRDTARQAVAAQMADRGWDPVDLAREAKADLDTVTLFLNGSRWPKISTQGRIERALGWAPGSVAAIERTGRMPELRSERSEVDLIREVADRLPRDRRGELLRYAEYLEAVDRPGGVRRTNGG